jgi:hypothetical protein
METIDLEARLLRIQVSVTPHPCSKVQWTHTANIKYIYTMHLEKSRKPGYKETHCITFPREKRFLNMEYVIQF